MTKIEDHKLYVLNRNYLWANMLLEHLNSFDSELDENDEEIQKKKSFQRFDIEFYLYLSLWYSLLYVVVEGWEHLKLYDKNVNKLLQSENTDLLRRYRNATFHYQELNDDPRVIRVMGDPEINHWANQLHVAFGIYFKEIFGSHVEKSLYPKHLNQLYIDTSLDEMLELMQSWTSQYTNKTKLTCPNCKKITVIRIGTMSPKSYTSRCCSVLLRPIKDECCVFCSYGDVKCFKKQLKISK